MEFHSLPNAIFCIEKMVGSEGQAEQLILQLHKLSKQIDSLMKAHQKTILENKQGQKERQQLKKKLRKVTAKLQKKEQECEQLQSDLVRTKDMYDHKICKLIRSREERQQEWQYNPQKVPLSKEYKKNKSRDVQCQILNEPLVKELQERNVFLLRKINQLQKDLQQQKNQNNSKQLYIESLLTALDANIKQQLQQSGSESSEEASSPENDCEDINDVSTIDADSLKDQERQSQQFPQAERKVWHESQFQEVKTCQAWYGLMQNAFKKVKFWISKV